MKYHKGEAKAAAKATFTGLWAAIPTPFTADGAVDEAGLRHNMRHYTDGLHVQGVFCTGVMGEFWSLTKEERKRIVEIVVEEARGKCGVIAHTAHSSARETIDLTRHAQEVGADFTIFINPYYPPAPESGIYDYFREVAAAVDIGMWMFDAGYSGYHLSPALTASIAALPNVCGIKLGAPPEHYAEVQRLCGDQIVMSHPSESHLLAYIRDRQMQTHMSSPAPYLMQAPGYLRMREYADLAWQGDFDAAARVAAELEPLRAVYEKWMTAPWAQRRVVPDAYLKAWGELLGMAGGPVRPPLPQITEAERAEMRADLERVGLLARVPARV